MTLLNWAVLKCPLYLEARWCMYMRCISYSIVVFRVFAGSCHLSLFILHTRGARLCSRNRHRSRQRAGAAVAGQGRHRGPAALTVETLVRMESTRSSTTWPCFVFWTLKSDTIRPPKSRLESKTSDTTLFPLIPVLV